MYNLTLFREPIFAALFNLVSSNVQLAQWAANKTYVVNVNGAAQIIDSNENLQQATSSGLSGTSVPVWNKTVGGTTVDNGVRWVNLGATTQFRLISRRFQPPDKEGVMPALYQVDGMSYEVDQLSQNAAYGVPRYVLHSQLWAYADAGQWNDPSFSPSTLANNILDLVEQSILTDDGDNQRLGGLVNNAYVQGKGIVVPGTNETGRIIVMVPIQIDVGFDR